jgi:hypothetical protein
MRQRVKQLKPHARARGTMVAVAMTMRASVVVVVVLAARAVAAQPSIDPQPPAPPPSPPNEVALRAGWMGIGWASEATSSGNGPFVELEGELRGRRIGGAAAIGVFTYNDSSTPERMLILDFALRLRFHVGQAFFGPGVAVWASLGPNSGALPLLELHGGYTWQTSGRVAPQLWFSAAGISFGYGAIGSASAGLGLRF